MNCPRCNMTMKKKKKHKSYWKCGDRPKRGFKGCKGILKVDGSFVLNKPKKK